AGNRILVDAAPRGEKSRDEIDAARTRRGDDDGEAVECRDRSEIGLERGDVVGAVVNREIVARGKEGDRPPAERGGERVKHRARLRRTGGKIERQKVAVARNGERAGLLCLEVN